MSNFFALIKDLIETALSFDFANPSFYISFMIVTFSAIAIVMVPAAFRGSFIKNIDINGENLADKSSGCEPNPYTKKLPLSVRIAFSAFVLIFSFWMIFTGINFCIKDKDAVLIQPSRFHRLIRNKVTFVQGQPAVILGFVLVGVGAVFSYAAFMILRGNKEKCAHTESEEQKQ